jgi:class 3 adenylate cyclase
MFLSANALLTACARPERRRGGRDRTLAAILAADVVGFSRLAGADEGQHFGEASCAAQRPHRAEDRHPPGRVVKRTGDGLIVEFRSVVVAVPDCRCAIEVQASVEHNAGPPPERRTSSASAFIPRRRRGERRRSHGRRVNIVARLQPGRGLPTPATPLDCGAAIRQRGHRPEQELFVDGITESLTTDLSRIRGCS